MGASVTGVAFPTAIVVARDAGKGDVVSAWLTPVVDADAGPCACLLSARSMSSTVGLAG